MDTHTLDRQLADITTKLDSILGEIELQRRHRREMEDLKEDLVRIGKDLYGSALEELDEVHDSIGTGDLLFLAKKILRNINTITAMFETLEQTRDFLQDFSPISRELFLDFMHRLDEFDRKGYFAFIRELQTVGDRVVTSFTVEDVKNLGDNIVTILNTVKNLTQPDMLHVVNNALAVYKKLDIAVDREVSLFSLLRELNTPEMKRGLVFAVKFLKSVAEQTQGQYAVSTN